VRVGLLVIELFLPGCASLKDKRRVVRSLLDGVRARHNVAAAEVDHQDLLQRAQLAFASVAGTDAPLERLFDRIVDEAERAAPGSVSEIARELLG
jgi:hypothetical protein